MGESSSDTGLGDIYIKLSGESLLFSQTALLSEHLFNKSTTAITFYFNLIILNKLTYSFHPTKTYVGSIAINFKPSISDLMIASEKCRIYASELLS